METGFALLHGEAVALGIALPSRFSADGGLCDAVEAERLTAHLERLDCMRLNGFGAEAAREAKAGDKKASGGGCRSC